MHKQCDQCGKKKTLASFPRENGEYYSPCYSCRARQMQLPFKATARPVPHGLSEAAALHFGVSRLHIGEMLECSCWQIARYFERYEMFRLENSIVVERAKTPGKELNHSFRVNRAASFVVAHILGDDAAPELRYRNVTRCGRRFEAWYGIVPPSTKNGVPFPREWARVVVYGDTAEDAAAEYALWITSVRAAKRKGVA